MASCSASEGTQTLAATISDELMIDWFASSLHPPSLLV